MHGLLSKVIAETFEEKVGKWQVKKGTDHKALLVPFRTKVDYDKEEGYRQLDVLIYGPMNYVGVYVRERWTVVSNDDIDENGDLKPGKDYRSGSTEWRRVSYHDSCWRTDGLDQVLFDHSYRITGFDALSSFYEVISVPSEIEQSTRLTRG